MKESWFKNNLMLIILAAVLAWVGAQQITLQTIITKAMDKMELRQDIQLFMED